MIDDLLKNIPKKYLYIGGGVLVFILLLIGITSCKGGGTTSTGERLPFKKDSFEKIEELMVEKTKEYHSTYPRKLPEDEGETKEVKVSILVNEGLMYDLNEYVSEGTKCTGRVAVTKIGDDKYTYTPYLNCGKAYKVVAFADEIKENNKDNNTYYILDSAESKYSDVADYEGLYYDEKTTDGDYFFRGSNINNYVKLMDRSIWRIISIDSEDNIHIISVNGQSNGQWDLDYNVTTGKSGRNEFDLSMLKTTLQEEVAKKDRFTDVIRGKLVKYKWCIGKRSVSETNMNGKIECSTLSDEALYVGAPALYEYLRASVDRSCTSSLLEVCRNDNFLSALPFWTITADIDSTDKVYSITSIPNLFASSSSGTYRPVVILNKNTIYTGGNGSKDDPYTIK